ncbi:MAG: FHA domain-containing protein [Chloroflexota bacterium]
MNLSMRSHRHLLIATIVTALLFVVGLAAAQAEARLEITSIDTAAFPEMHVMLLATDGQSQRRPDVGGLLLRENDVPIDGYETAEKPVGVELTFVIDANRDIEARDDNSGLTRREKVRDSILLFAEQYMDGAQLDRVSIIVPDGDSATVLLDNAVFPNEVINEINFWEGDTVANVPVNAMLALAIERAAALKDEGRFQAVLLYSDAGRLDSQLDYDQLNQQAQAINLPIFAAILGAQADNSEIANVNGLTEPSRGNWVHMTQSEEIAPLLETIVGNRPQFELVYRSGLATSGPRSITAGLEGAQAQGEAMLEIAPPAAEIAVDNSRPIRRVAPEPGAALADAEPSSQPIAAQVSWPDGYPRAITEATLLVNGDPQPAVADPAIDESGLLSLDWDISRLDEGSYDLTIQVVDELGLEGESAPLPMGVVVEGMAPVETPAEAAPTVAAESASESLSDGVTENLSLLTIGVAFLALFAAVAVLIVAVVLMRRRQSAPAAAPGAQPAPVAVPIAPADHDATQVIMPAFVASKQATAYFEPLENAPDHQGNIPISGESITIGRDSNLAQIVFADKSVSRLHARIMQSGGSFRLYDEGSASGTYINYEQVGLTPQVLNNNDDVHIGRVHLRFHVTAVEDDADSTQVMPAPQSPRAPQPQVDDGMSTQPYMPQQPGQYQPPPQQADDDEDDISTQPFMPHQPRR